MDEQGNPYASPMAPVEAWPHGQVAGTDAERTRREYLKHEASVQSIGTLYYLGTILLGFATVGMLSELATLGRLTGLPVFGPAELFGLAICGGLAVLSFFLGRGLRNLEPWVKGPVGILSAVGLLGFPLSILINAYILYLVSPLSTLINVYILYLVFSAKGRVVFSPEYREIIRQTPHIKYQTSIVVVIFLVLLVLLFVVMVVGLLVG